MNSTRTTNSLTKETMTMAMNTTELASKLTDLGLRWTAENLDDLVALATKKRWGIVQILEYMVERELEGARRPDPREQVPWARGNARGSSEAARAAAEASTEGGREVSDQVPADEAR
jgi:hypothetical protein